MASSHIVREKTYADAVRGKHKILLAICGCESAEKFGQLIKAFLIWAKVKVIVTKSAKEIVKPPMPDEVDVYKDDHQWLLWEKKGSCLHAELCTWADIMVIAPLSVHARGKIAGGYCDTLLTSVVRAWNCEKKPLFVAPCMDHCCKENNVTVRNFVSLKELGINIITRVPEKQDGKMPEPEEISKFVRNKTS